MLKPMIVSIALLGSSGLAAVGAQQWHKGAFCMSADYCQLLECEVSDVSPATVYENNEVYGAKIVDGGDDRVDVISQGSRFVFFRTQKSCGAFLAEQKRLGAQRRRDQDEQLERYR